MGINALLAAALIAMLLAIRQAPSPPPAAPARVSGQIVQNGQGVIEGEVRRFNSEDPISEAQVTLTGGPQTSATATVGQLRTSTDISGRFVFRNLPPGQYFVGIQRDGYSRRIAPGGPDPGQVQVGPGQSVSRVVFSLIPGGTISGRLLDTSGRPAAQAMITAARVNYANGSPALIPVKSTMSDDRGDYRLYWLEPGEYVVMAEKNLPSGMARSYFPGGDDGRAAVKLIVDAGAESAKNDFSLATASTTVNVSGVVNIDVAGFEGPSPSPPRNPNASREERAMADVRAYEVSMAQQFYLVPIEPGRLYEAPVAFSNAVTDNQDRAAGKFELRRVRPGVYELYAVFQDRRGATPKYYVAHTPIEVGAQDVGGVVLAIVPGIDLTGNVRYGGGAAIPATPVRIQLRPKVVLPGWPGSSLSVVVSAEGTFAIPNVPESQYAISVGPLDPDSYVSELRQGRSSILDRDILIVDRRLPGTLEVLIASPAAKVRGTVSASPQQLAAGVTITLVPEDNRRENLGLYKRTVATPTGSFFFSDVTPGAYKLFAWETIPEGAEQNRDFMEFYAADGTEIEAVAGSTSSVGLRLTSK